jgi:serine phosphatase RsbU (regulator of sigma subunit)/ligand-binding sensor domain-containing protein
VLRKILHSSFFVFLLISEAFSYAQSDTIHPLIKPAFGRFQVNEISSEIGMLGATVEYIFQDSKGYVWIATRSGINRYDGFTFKTYTEDDGLAFNLARCIEEDKEGNIWIATENGVSCFDGFRFKNFGTDDGMAHRQVWWLKEHKEEGMMVGTGFGIDLIRNGEVEHFLDIDTSSHKNNQIRSINYDSMGNLWVGATGGFYRFNDQMESEKIQYSNFPQAFLETSDGSIWMGSWGKYCWRYKDGQTTQYEIGTPTTGFDEGIDGSIWISTWEKGLVKFDGDSTWTKYGIDQGLTLNTVWDVMVDAEGCVWGATYGAGANQLVNERFAVFDSRLGLSNDVVNDIVIDCTGNIWAGTNEGINMIRPDGSLKVFDEYNGINNGILYNMIVDSNNHVWAIFYAGKQGVVEFANEEIEKIHGFGGGFDIMIDSRGNFWWGSDGSGVDRKWGPDPYLRYSPSYVGHNRGYKIFEDREGRIWFGLDHTAFHVYHPDQNIFYDSLWPPHLEKIAGVEMAQDYKGNLWLALERKAAYICNYEEGSLTIIDTLNKAFGLPDNAVWGFMPEGNVMWMNTQGGLSKMNLKAYYDEDRVEIKNYTAKQGYLGDGTSSLIRKDKNEILMGSSKGMLVYHENYDRPVKAAPFTNITGVKLDKQEMDWEELGARLKKNTNIPEEVTLEYHQNHLTFSFVGISFTAPEQIRYSYMLEGFDNDWSPLTDQGEITYSNIPAGDYIFKVKSVNLDGVWDETPDSVIIHITPPFWQTWWFIVLMIFIGLFLVVLVFRWRLAKLQKDKERLENKVSQRTEQLQVAYDQIEEKNLEITDSISYAKRIQEAILPPPDYFKKKMGESFVLYRPKDIVAGDFYWLNEIGDKILFAAADCTGHGVPGAMVSVVCNGALNRSVREFGLNEPAKILDKTREIVIETFSKSKTDVKDGMDVAVCSLDRKAGILEYSGANNSLYIIRNNEIEEVKSDRQPVGKYEFATDFTNHRIQVEKGMCVYLFSDGFADQFGGEKGKKFKYKPFKQVLVKIHKLPMEEQLKILNDEFDKWRGDFEQVDDICIIGIRL